MKRLFVDFIFEYLNNNFDYLILRNYENLPEDEGHDIDLLISSSEIEKTTILLELLKEKFNVHIFKNYRYNNLRSHIIVFENEILHLDFFTSVQWNRVDLFETSFLLDRKVKFKCHYWVMNPIDFQNYCWFQSIIRKGNLKKDKYINASQKWIINPNFKDIGIDINNNYVNKNKLLFFIYFLKRNPICFVLGSIKNIFFKIKKIINPYGKIFDPESNVKNIDMCVKFCFIGHKKFTSSKRDYLAVLKIYFALSDEQGIILSTEFLQNNYEVKLLLKKYFVKTTDNLKQSVKFILNN